MTIKTTIIGATISAAVAMAFVAAPFTAASAADNATVKCFGVNACKGKGACKTNANGCKGQNSCKGKGFMEMKTAEECTKAGGSEKDPNPETK